MNIKITTSDPHTLIVQEKVIKVTVNPFDTEGSKLPLSLFKRKGDILAARGDSDPAPVPVGSEGQMLVVDGSSETGVSWKTVGWGVISLSNAEALPVVAGSVCVADTTPGTFRLATNADTTNFYVASQNILSGEVGVLYAVSGVSCYVICAEPAISTGDGLEVSATPGMAQKATTGSVFATAVTSKPVGVVSLLQCILVSTVTSVISVPEGGTGQISIPVGYFLIGNGINPIQSLSAAAARAHLGAMPASLSRIELNTDNSTPSSGGYIDFHFNGSTADFTARLIEQVQGQLDVVGKLNVSDKAGTRANLGVPGIAMLAAGSLNNKIIAGNYRLGPLGDYTDLPNDLALAYSILEIISGPAVGSDTGLQRITPYGNASYFYQRGFWANGANWTPWSKFTGISTAQWWLAGGLSASNCIAAYQFKGIGSENEALNNRNSPGSLILGKWGTPTWNNETGFYIPGGQQVGLYTSGITSFADVIVRYSGNSNSDGMAGLVGPANGYHLMAKWGGRINDVMSYRRFPTFYSSTGESSGRRDINAFYEAAVLGWARNSWQMYVNGINQSVVAPGIWSYANDFYHVTIGHAYRANASVGVPAFTPINIQAVAFYDTNLTAAQHQAVAAAMAAL